MTASHTGPVPVASRPLTVGLLRQLLAGVSAHLMVHVAVAHAEADAGTEMMDAEVAGLGAADSRPVVGLGIGTAGRPDEELAEDAVLLWYVPTAC